MADVLFITPNTKNSAINESVGTLLLATVLRQNGVFVEILSFSRFGNPTDFQSFLNNAVEMICREQPKIVSFYTRCDCYHIMLRIAERIKNQTDAYTVFGGPQSDVSAVDTLREISYVDYICCGEGENTVYPFFSSLLRGEPDITVPGLAYRSGDRIVQNSRPKLVENLDSLPEIDYSVSKSSLEVGDAEWFPIDVGRGCPFGCTYCSTKSFWGRKYRLKSPQRVLYEIKRINEQFGTLKFELLHDMFTMNRAKVVETCGLLNTLDFPISWVCSARIDCIDKELVDIMVESGMKGIYIGIESGSPRMQKIINKNLNLDRVMEMISYIYSKNIKIVVSFIYGFPEETEEDISQTMSLIAQIAKYKKIEIQTHLCTFLPGTELSQKYMSDLTSVASFSDVTGAIAVEECSELIEAHPKLFQHFCEYKTDLRTRLEFFSVFFRMWHYLQPVYQYLAETYYCNRLLDMYYDFSTANHSILQKIKGMSAIEQFERIIQEDCFAAKFKDDEYYDLIADFHRMVALHNSERFIKSGIVTDAFCFSPEDIARCSRLQYYNRNLTFVTFTREQDGSLKFRIRNVN